jgi:hypothetical protein
MCHAFLPAEKNGNRPNAKNVCSKKPELSASVALSLATLTPLAQKAAFPLKRFQQETVFPCVASLFRIN